MAVGGFSWGHHQVRKDLILYLCLILIVRVSCGFLVPQKLHVRGYFCRLHQTRENDVNGDGPIDGDDLKSTTSSTQRQKKKRCPDFPSFAFEAGVGGDDRKRASPSSVRIRRSKVADEALSADTSSWVYKVASELPVEPGLFLDVANSARRTRLLKYRAYASEERFAPANITCPPSLADLDQPPPAKSETFWISTPARLLSLVTSIFSFPYIISGLDRFVTLPPEQLNEISSTFGPGISILYGTFVSLTLSILYSRQKDIQDDISEETALLTVIVRNFMTMFARDKELAVEAAQIVADQIRILVKGSRAAELTLLMYSDPYARMLELLAMQECQVMSKRNGELGGQGNILGSCRDIVNNLVRIRSKRLSHEALALPPTHFFILTTLTMLILLGYCVSTLPTVGPDGMPSFESSVLFGVLFTVYVFFYCFAADLNDPFLGVYQIRRSSAASHLLQLKWFLANHPLLRGEVDFEEVEEDVDGDIRIRSPGLGDFWFEKEDIYPDSTIIRTDDEIL